MKPPRRDRRSRPTIWGVATIVIVCAAVAAWWLNTGTTDLPKPARSSKSPSRIKEVKPAPAPVARELVEKKEIPYWELPTTNGLTALQLHKWRHKHMRPSRITNDTSRTEAPAPYEIFEDPVDNEIAFHLWIKPGQTLVGTPIYGERFNKAFLKSLEHPIIATAEDDDWTRDMKKAVVEVKKELKARLDGGEDVGDILLQTRREYQKLYNYKETLRNELIKLSSDGEVTEEDKADFLKAANLMLESKGIEPLQLGPVTSEMLKLNHGKIE